MTETFLSKSLWLVLSLVLGFLLRTLLDFGFGRQLIKYLSYKFFLGGDADLRGDWMQYWRVESINFKNDDSCSGSARLWQAGRFCYAEFLSSEDPYSLFGVIRGDYLVGHWYSKKDGRGYFGTFELEIKNSNELRGVWIGHSKESRDIKADQWAWRRGPF